MQSRTAKKAKLKVSTVRRGVNARLVYLISMIKSYMSDWIIDQTIRLLVIQASWRQVKIDARK